MAYTTVISSDTVYKHLNDSQWRIIDCRYYLEKPQQGEEEYSQSHVPGALYAHLDKDLSSTVVPGVTGRHPLPEVNKLCALFSQWGVDNTVQVVVYDQGPGMIAARLWWMLRWLGHDAVAVMEGGWNKWLEEAKPVTQEAPVISSRRFTAKVQQHLVASIEDVLASMNNTDMALIDARAADRYRGENETLDPVAGHIPHALSIPFMDHVDSKGCLRSSDELRALYSAVMGDVPASNAIVYCGSGVTAALNIVALKHAGLGMAKLYPGSWSHWITDENRPIVTDE
jgi:thiosulfate/3-mercaptopyruvate sulfurtransferase